MHEQSGETGLGEHETCKSMHVQSMCTLTCLAGHVNTLEHKHRIMCMHGISAQLHPHMLMRGDGAIRLSRSHHEGWQVCPKSRMHTSELWGMGQPFLLLPWALRGGPANETYPVMRAAVLGLPPPRQ